MANQPDERGQGLARGLNRTGVAFLVLGLVAMALPAAMTLAVELLIAVLLLVWGAAGLGVSLMLRPARGWAAMALFFALVLALGTLLAVAPRAGIATLTMVMIAVFVVEGVSSILIGLRMRGRTPGWGWIVFSGAASLVLGGLILAGWPGSAAWVLGLLVGFNFLSTGISLLVVGSLLAAPGHG